MLRGKISFGLLFSVVLSLHVNAINIDSVEFLLKKNNPLLTRIYLRNAAAQYYIKHNPALAIQNNNITFNLLNQLNIKPNDSIYLEAEYTKGLYLSRIQDVESAIKLLDRIYKTATESKLKKLAAKALVDMAINYESLGNYQQASDGYYEALNIYKELNDDKGILMQSINLGLIHQYQKNYAKSLLYYKRAIGIAERIGYKAGLIAAYNNLGINYEERGVYDSALFYFEQVLAYDVEQADSLSIGSSYNNIGVVQLGLKNYSKAEEFFLLALEYKKMQNDSQGYANTCNNLAETYLHIKPSNVLVWLDQAYQIAYKKGFKGVLVESYQIYADYFKSTGDFKQALSYKEKYHALNDSLKSDELNIKLEQIQRQYELEHLAKENAEKDIAITKQIHTEKLYYLLFIGLLIGAGFMVYAIYKSKQLNRKLELQKRQIVNQNRILHANNIELNIAKDAAEEATQAKSQFLSTMSHEIRTPLNAIIGLANLLNENNPRPDQRDNIEVLKTSSNNLLAILNDVLDFSKLEAGKMEIEMVDFNLKTLVSHLYELFSVKANEKGLKLTLDFDYKIPPKLRGDSLHINQVLSNLISNAIKFTHEGSIQIAVVLNSKDMEKYHITFSVADTGIGIPLEKQQAIFESFTQADSNTTRVFGGTGLGLSISTKLLAMLGSKLILKSESKRGSVFSFELDLDHSTQQKTEMPEILLAEDQDSKLWGRKVLLAEDNQINLFVVKQFLNKWGVSIAVAENGLQAVDMALSQNFDLILMDLHMPMMDGYLATQRILEDKPNQVILAMTANQDREVERRSKEVGMKGVILKPFQPEQLAKQLEEALIN